MAGKKTQGRKKIEMKKIKDADVRRITFSKRRSGLFKKASELSTLCGIQIAIIVYSIGGKAFSFGHPSVESVIKRFEGKAHELQEDYISRYANSFRDARLRELNQQFNDLNDKLAEERNKRKIFRRSFKGFGCRNFEDFIDNIDLPRELMQVKGKLEMLKEYLTQEVKESPDHEEDSPNSETIYYLDKIGNVVHEDVNDYSSMEISRKHCHEFIFPIIGERAKEVNEPSAESSSKKLFVKNKVKDSSVSLGWLKLGE